MQRTFIRKLLSLCFALAIAFYCIHYLVSYFEWKAIFGILKNVRLEWLIVGGSATVVSYWLLRTLRWSILLKNFNINVRFSHLYLCTSIALGASLLTPFQSGEVLKIELLKHYGLVNRMPGYSTLLVERIIDFLVVAFIALLGAPLLFRKYSNTFYMYVLVGTLIFFILLCVLIIQKIQFHGSISLFLNQIKTTFSHTQHLILIIAITIFGWIMVALGWHVCLYSISINLDFQYSLGLMAIMTLVNVLSFVPGAIGVSEVGTAEILQQLGYNIQTAQTGAVILRIYALIIFILGLVHLLFWKRFSFTATSSIP